MKPHEAVVAVTYRCNSRCQMCNIWKTQEHTEMAPAHYVKLPRSLRTVNVSGGEPFLRRDLIEVVRAMHSSLPDARLVFSTNGFLTESILFAMEEIGGFHSNLGVGVSIDGSEETHDRMRGVKGGYKKAVATVEGLKSKGFEDLRIGMTLVPENIGEVGEVHTLARGLGVELTLTMAHNSEFYFKKTDNVKIDYSERTKASIVPVVDSHLRSSRPKDWVRAYHFQGIIDPRMRRAFVSQCEAGRNYFFMAPNGDVYPCNVMNEIIGNLGEVKSWDDLFLPSVENRVAELVRSCRSDCWMVCNARSLVLRHPLRVSSWVAKNKILAHARQR